MHENANTRDNFSSAVRQQLRKRAGERCSNPGCRRPTSGPQVDNQKSITIGAAAHIRAAAPKGPRYEASMDTKGREDIDNAVWLCQNCHKLVDDDSLRYPVDLLLRWKSDAEQLAFQAISEPALSDARDEAATHPHEVVELGDNNVFHGTIDDLKALATRCAIRAIDGEPTRFTVRLLPTVWMTEATHPLVRPHYEKARRRYAEPLKDCLEILTSPEAYAWWSSWLSDVPDWQAAIATLLERAAIPPLHHPGHKVDVWRTAKPSLSAPIHLSDTEIQELLERVRMPSMQALAYGAGNWNALDLPHNVAVKHLLPRVTLEFVGRDLAAESHALNLLEWHIGNG